jgi:hypothetical protein
MERRERHDTKKNERPLKAKAGRVADDGEHGRAGAGPSTRDRLNCVELSAIAFGRSFRGTSCGIID